MAEASELTLKIRLDASDLDDALYEVRSALQGLLDTELRVTSDRGQVITTIRVGQLLAPKEAT